MGCATSGHPCEAGGDISWNAKIRGDRSCYVKKLKDGRVVNHGKYVQYYPDGHVAIEGNFVEGKRDGLWVQYNERGEKIAERYFENGIEKMVPAGK
jgi:antitoxin component YwqK of YwqJK toxin-antitoxin module